MSKIAPLLALNPRILVLSCPPVQVRYLDGLAAGCQPADAWRQDSREGAAWPGKGDADR